MYPIAGSFAVLLAAQFAIADNFTWTGTDGTNPLLWDTTVAQNWNDTTTATNPTKWVNGATSAAFFDATAAVNPATVSLGNDNIVAGSITFATAGWTIGTTGTGTLASAPAGTLAITNNSANTNTISAIIADNGGATGVSVGGAAILLTNTNTYTGPTSILGGGTLALSPTGSVVSNVTVGFGAGFNINTTGTGTRAGSVTLINSNVTLNGSTATGNTSDTVGALNISKGADGVSVTPNSGFTSTLTFASLNHVSGSTVTFTGAANFGAAAGANVSQIMFTTAPTLIGGTVGTTSSGIIPYALAVDTNSGALSFATYDTNGIRPLVNNVDNTGTLSAGVNLVNSGSSMGGVAINSLTIASGAGPIVNSGTTAITSGGLMVLGTSNTALAGGTLDFGSAEGYIHMPQGGQLTTTAVINGTNGLTKTGLGTIIVGTANTYSGTTTIVGGRYQITGDGGLGVVPGAVTPGSIMLIGPGTLATNATFTLNSNRGIGLGPTDGTNGFGQLFVNAGTTLTYGGIIANNGTGIDGLSQSGNGSLILTGANTYNGPTSLHAGFFCVNNDNNFGLVPSAPLSNSIQMNGAGIQARANVTLNANRGILIDGVSGGNAQLTANVGTTLTINGVISEQNPGDELLLGSGAGNISGTLVLNGLNTFSKDIRWNGGNPEQLSFNSESVSGASELGLVPTSVVPNYIQDNAGIFTFTGNGSSTTVTLSVNRGILLGPNSTAAGSGTIDAQAGATLVIPGVITQFAGGTGSLVKGGGASPGTGTVVLQAANTYSGNTTISSGTLSISADNNLGNGATPSLIINSGTLQITSNMTLGSNRAVKIGPNNSNVSNGSIEVTTGNTATYNGVVSNQSALVSSNQTLINKGAGTLILGGTNTYSGGTTVNGNLIVNNSHALGFGFSTSAGPNSTTVNAGGSLDLNGMVSPSIYNLNGGTLQNNGAAVTIDSTGTIANTSFVNSTGVFLGSTINVAGGGGSNAALSPTFGLQAASLTFNGGTGYTSAPTITFAGGTNGGVNATATVQVSGGAITGITFTSPGSNYTGAPTITLGAVTGASGGSFTFADGNMAIAGIRVTNNGSGYTSMPTATLSTGTSTITVLPSSLNIAANSTISGTGDITLNNAVTGTGMLTKAGSNTLTLSVGSPSWSGGVDLTSGTLKVTNASGSGTGTGGVTLDGGTLGGGGMISGTVTGGAGGTIFPSVGLATNAATTLTVGGLTTNANTTLKFNLVTPESSNDMIAVSNSGGLSLSGGTLDFTNHTTGAAGVGYYKIMSYTGAIGGTGVSSLTVPATANSIAYFVTTSQDPGFVDVHRGYLGDANDNGFVDLTDLTILATNWQHSGNWNQGDFDGSGFIDLTDLTILASHWQTGIGSFGQAAESIDTGNASFQAAVQEAMALASVPEPTSLTLLGLGAAGLLSRRRRR